MMDEEKRAKHIAYCRARYRANKNAMLAQQAAYRAANPEKVAESKRREYQKNREKYLARAKEYNAANPEVNKAAVRKYRAENREKENARCVAWRAANGEKRKEICRTWDRANPEKKRAHRENRRARFLGAEGSYTTKDANAIRVAQGSKCAYCKDRLGRRAHLDHIIPLSGGGSNWPSNLQWLCVPCNLSKGALDPVDYAQKRGLLI